MLIVPNSYVTLTYLLKLGTWSSGVKMTPPPPCTDLLLFTLARMRVNTCTYHISVPVKPLTVVTPLSVSTTVNVSEKPLSVVITTVKVKLQSLSVVIPLYVSHLRRTDYFAELT